MKKQFLLGSLAMFVAVLALIIVQQTVSANQVSQKCRDYPLGPILCEKMPSVGDHVEVAWGLNTNCHGDVQQVILRPKKQAEVKITENPVGCHATIGTKVWVTWKIKI